MNGIQYEKWARHYDPEYKELQILEKHDINFAGKKILEVGCGTGRFTARMLPQCKEITCIEPDDDALTVLKANIVDSRLKIHCGTFDIVPIPRGYYDYVVFSWSMYLIPEKTKNIKLAYDCLKPGGKLIILQANSGEYEEEIAQLYSKYNPLREYESAYNNLSNLVKNIFGNVTCDTLETFFSFDSVDQVIATSLFFIEDEEGMQPSECAIEELHKRLFSYVTENGKVIMSDIVSIFISRKEDNSEKR